MRMKHATPLPPCHPPSLCSLSSQLAPSTVFSSYDCFHESKPAQSFKNLARNCYCDSIFQTLLVNNPFRLIKSLLEPALELIAFVVSPSNSIISIKIIMVSFNIFAFSVLKGQYLRKHKAASTPSSCPHS